MATTPRDIIVKTETRTFKQMPNIAGNVIHSGDAVWVNTPALGTSTYDIRALATDAQAAAFAGICQDTYDPTNYSVYGSDPVPANGMMVQCAGIWKPWGTSGETYTPGAAVYIGADAQTVTLGTTASANPIGYVADLPDASQRALVATGTGTIPVQVYIRSNWPNTTV